jgi:hypothetical protein
MRWGHPSRNGCETSREGHNTGREGAVRERATERLALDPLAALDPSSTCAHSKTLTLRSPISQFLQGACQGCGLMSSLSCEEAWRLWIPRGCCLTRRSPELLPAARRREACTLVRLQRRVVRNLRRAEVESATCTPHGDERAQGGTVRGDQSPAETSDPASLISTPPPSHTGATGERRRCMVALAAPAGQSGPEGGAEFEGGGAEPAPRS